MMIHRKFVWLMILMVWVGMVTSIITYQGGNFLASDRVTSGKVTVNENNIQQSKQETENTNQQNKQQNKEDFFIEYRLERDKARSEQINIYREMINNPNTDEATKKEAQNKMLELTDKMEKEMEIESLIRARGFEEALAYIHDNTVDVIVQTKGLQKEDVAKVGDIVVKTTGFDLEDVTIIEKKLDK